MKMYKSLLKNEFQKNPWSNFIIFLLMTLSVMVTVSVFLLLTHLYTSISSMYKVSNPPHFLQMHKGELKQEDIDAFCEDYPGIEHWQTVQMIDVYGDDITVSEKSKASNDNTLTVNTLSDCRLDISLVKQNQEYDVLLDENRKPLYVKKGEIGIPVILLEQYPIQIGDEVCLQSGSVTRDFVVAGYVYDAQMNSTLCSSTRFLISDDDFAEMAGKVGETEYIIEAYFTDTKLANDFQTAYEESDRNLPKEGQAVTYPMIFLLSALIDMMTAFVLLLAGIGMMIVALVCLRYTILASVEQDMKEIGTMKALGIPSRGICNLYIWRIRILMMLGSFVGYTASIAFVAVFMGRMNRIFGKQSLGYRYYALAVILCIGLYGMVMMFTKIVLAKIKKITVIDALILEKGLQKETKTKDRIHVAKKIPINMLIGLQEVQHGYGIVFVLLILVSSLILIPYQVMHTMENQEFCTYMGCAPTDAMIEIGQGETLEIRRTETENYLDAEMKKGNIAGVDCLKQIRLQAIDTQGKRQGIHIDTGEQAGVGLHYLVGGEPMKDDEIAISSQMAEQLGKSQGQKVTLISNQEQYDYIISGIYQDITSGGKTAKLKYFQEDVQAEKYSYGITFSQDVDQEQWIIDCRKQLHTGYQVENMRDYLAQTLGGMVTQVKHSVMAVLVVGELLVALIVMLYLKLRIVREAKAFAGKKAMGISFIDICKQEVYPIFIAGILGIIVGICMTELLGDSIVSVLLQCMGIGIDQMSFAKITFQGVIGIPMLLLMVLVISAWVACMEIKQLDIIGYINQE